MRKKNNTVSGSTALSAMELAKWALIIGAGYYVGKKLIPSFKAIGEGLSDLKDTLQKEYKERPASKKKPEKRGIKKRYRRNRQTGRNFQCMNKLP